MVDLILSPTLNAERFALQLRYHDSYGPTEYYPLVTVDEDVAREIIMAGGATWLLGDPRLKAKAEKRKD